MPVVVEVCTGPTCKPLGNNGVLAMLSALPAKDLQRVDVRPQYCFSRCQMPGTLCPSVRVDGTWLVQANEQSVRAALRSALANTGNDEEDDADPWKKYFPNAND